MPRYYFEVDGLPPAPDEIGEELDGDEAAWHEATYYSGALLKEDGKLRPGQEWRLTVADADRNPGYVIHVRSQKLKWGGGGESKSLHPNVTSYFPPPTPGVSRALFTSGAGKFSFRI